MIQDINKIYLHKCFLIRYYFNKIANTIKEIISNEEGLILDFGCGQQYLKQIMPDKDIVGYDVVTKFSDVEDYTTTRPKIIIASHVLEHLNITELRTAIINFKGMNPNYIITAQPTENWIANLGDKLFNLNSRAEHTLKINEVYFFMKEHFTLCFERDILTMTKVAVWK